MDESSGKSAGAAAALCVDSRAAVDGPAVLLTEELIADLDTVDTALDTVDFRDEEPVCELTFLIH